jgi:hypothetical protein
MAILSTGGEQGFEAADGSGTGCSLSAAQRARPISLRPRQCVERRLFCLHCGWSGLAPQLVGDDLGEHLAWHPGAGAVKGVDWASGHRYGQLDGRPRRGRPKTLPPLRMRLGTTRTAEQRAKASAAGGATVRRQARERAAARGNAAGG